MKCEITGENDERVGMYVYDNNKTEHWIEMEFDGEIKYHEWDDDVYPARPENRTSEQGEHVAQARRFARFYVYRKRGYDTLDPWDNPDRVMMAAIAIGQLSEDAFERHFNDLYQQMCSHSGTADPVVDVPDAVGENPLYYQQDVYVALDIDDLRELSEEGSSSDELEQITSMMGASALTNEGFHGLSAIASDAGVDLSDSTRETLADLSIEALSDIRVTWWPPGAGESKSVGGEPPVGIDRGPDARLDLPPYEADSLADFQTHVAYHLKCQVRDIYLTMGIAPPEDLRVRGPGRFGVTTWLEHNDNYQQYHRQDVEITDWKVEHTPDDISY